MDGPGLSIFQGSDIKINNSLQRREEEEFLEEGKKREAELKDLFEEAFDDLNGDTSLDSSHYSTDVEFHPLQSNFQDRNNETDFDAPLPGNIRSSPAIHVREKNKALHIPINSYEVSKSEFNQIPVTPKTDSDLTIQHYNHCFKKPGYIENSSDVNIYKNADSDSLEQLKVLYDVRLREIDRLRKDLDIEKDAKEEALHQLALAHSKLETTNDSHERTKQILVLSQEKITDLEKLVNSLKSEILKLEKDKHEFESEVEIGHQQILCLQQKISALERCDISSNREKQVDAFIESLNAKHKKELAILEQKCDLIMSRYNQKEEECRQLELKLDELERKRSALVLEKCNVALRQENDIEALLDQANAEKIELNRKLVALQGECDMLKGDLDQYESVNKLKLLWGGSSSDEGESYSRLTGGLPRCKSGSARAQASPQLLDLNAKLKEELHRAILGKRSKRHEINKLQEQVCSKELQIQEMKEKERAYLSQAESLKADIARVMELHNEKIKKNSLDEKMELEVTHLKAEIEILTNENQKLEKIISELNLQIEQLMKDVKSEYSTRVKQGEDYIGFHDGQLTKLRVESQKLLEQREVEWRNKLEFALKECDEMKRMYMELRSSKNEISTLLEEEKRKLSHIIQQKEHLETLQKDKEVVISQLQEENSKLKLEKELKSQLHAEIPSNQRSIPQLEEEIERLRHELVELPKKQTQELEGLKNELDAAKVRLIELEKKLKKEFQSKVSIFLAEKESLEDEMRKKDLLIKKLEKIPNQTEDCATMTEREVISENDSYSMENIYKKKFESELKVLEDRLVTQHSVELAAAEERIKNVTVKYYAEQMERLEEKYKKELMMLLGKEREKIEQLTKILADREKEIQKLQSLGGPSEKYLLLQRKLEEDRSKIAETVKKWTSEVEVMKSKMSEDEKRIQELNTALKIERKNVHKYKMKLDNVKKKMEQEKIENIVKMKNHIDCLMTTINQVEEKATDKLLKVEQEFAQKEKELRAKFELQKRKV